MSDNFSVAMKNAKEQQLKETAEDIVKYQKFKNTVILEKMRAQHLAKSSRYNYISCGRYYLKTGEKYKNVVGSSFYKYMQEAIDKHIQPLTPSLYERKREIKKDYTKKENKPPIAKILENKKLTTNIEYGIKIDDKIILEKNEENARAFLKGVLFLNNNCGAKLVTVELVEVD